MISKNTFMACDPGLNGYMVEIVDGVVYKYPFPKIGDEYDIQGMMELFEEYEPEHIHVVIEDVKALQKPMDKGNWSLSRGKTILEMCCVFYNLPFTMVAPKTWQKEIWQGIPIQRKADGKKKNGETKWKNLTKETTLLAVKRLFPKEDLRGFVETTYYVDSSANRKKGIAGKEIPRTGEKAHDGLVDALAMAEYCRRKFK